MTDVTIIDLECGNIASVEFALDRLGATHHRTQCRNEINSANRILLPGVGAAGYAMQRLAGFGLIEPIRNTQKPLLGICLGMQLLFQYSEEGNTECLGLVNGEVTLMQGTAEMPVPHMGWSNLDVRRPDSPLITDVEPGYVYFVHSFAAEVNDNCVASASYGRPISAIVQSDNIYGCQFHPERSSAVGAQILGNFLELPC